MDLKTFEEIILYAIRKEVEAATLYRTYANLTKSGSVREIFKNLEAEEQKHQKILESLRKEDFSAYRLEKIPDLKISDYYMEQDYSPDISYQEALILAIKREEKAVKLYQDLASGAADTEIKKTFESLAQEEAKHKLKLETEYDQRVLTED